MDLGLTYRSPWPRGLVQLDSDSTSMSHHSLIRKPLALRSLNSTIAQYYPPVSVPLPVSNVRPVSFALALAPSLVFPGSN